MTLCICIGTMFQMGTLCAGQTQGAYHVYELISSAKTLPNPHSPFWIASEKLGFVTGKEAKRKLEGGLFVYSLNTKDIQDLFNRPVFFPTMLQKKMKISFADIGKKQSLTLFTMSIAGKDIIEYEFGPFSPSWSPDNRKVVFADLSYDANLVIADTETHVIEGLGDLGRGTETEGTEAPDWSPNGTNIVYVGWDKSSRSGEDQGVYHPIFGRIYRFDLPTRRYSRLTEGLFQDRYPSYSPDGRYIAFISNRSGNMELWVMNSDGSNLRQLTDMVKQGYQVVLDKPAWSPDQDKIAFPAKSTKNHVDKEGWYFNGSSIWILDLGQPMK